MSEGVPLSLWLSDVDGTTCGDGAGMCSARVKEFFCHSGCVMLMAHPVVMMLAVRSSVIIIKTLLLIMK